MKQAAKVGNSWLVAQLTSWLAALESALKLPAAQIYPLLHDDLNSALTSLSPLKRAKFSPSKSLLDHEAEAKTLLCWKILLRLLLLRSCELSLVQPGLQTLAAVSNLADLTTIEEFTRTYPFATYFNSGLFGPTVWQEAILLEVVKSIGSLTAPELTGEFLATLSPQPELSGKSLRKRTGAYYTPPILAHDIVAKTLEPFDLQGNGCPTVVDPACGSGIFLIAVLNSLVANGVSPFTALLHIYGLDLNPQARDIALLSLVRRISEIANQLLDFEILEIAALHLKVGNALIGSLRTLAKDEHLPTSQIFSSLTANEQDEALSALPIFNSTYDGLQLQKLGPFHWQTVWPEIFVACADKSVANTGFDVVVGNPPYINFNDYSGIEKAYFAHVYPEIYNLKSDLLYYFIKRGVDLLKSGGRLGFVTSRFWLAAVWAANLRGWLLSHTTLDEIQDLKATNLFAGANVDVALLFLTKQPPTPTHHFNFVAKTASQPMSIAQSRLGNTPWVWLHRPDAVTKLLQKINAQSITLGTVAECRTGVQTGYDKAFFATLREFSAAFEPGLLRQAIKNSDIRLTDLAAACVTWNKLYLLYPPFELAELAIEEYEQNYPVVAHHLLPYRAHLEERRRYAKKFPYYQLQWPREAAVFEASTKLVTPYKAQRNTFAVDTHSFFFSTDVISIVLKRPSWLLGSNLEVFAANFLCSRLSTFQFRSYSKPVSSDLYDYYANAVKQMAFPGKIFSSSLLVEESSPTSAYLLKDEEKLLAGLAKPELTAVERDKLVYQLYDLSEAEVALIEANVE